MAFDWKLTKKRIKEHLDKKFLLVIRNEDTFEETASYKLSLMNIYILLSSVVFAVGFLLMMLIIITPFKRYIPGYGDIRANSEFILMQKKIENLQEEMVAQEVYISGIQRLLTGKPQYGADIAKDIKITPTTADPLPKIREDSLLRQEFESNRRVRQKPNSFSQNSRQLEMGNNYSVPLSELELEAPIRGTLGADYRPDKDHFGIDIIAPAKSPVKAVMEGSVINADWSIENGHTIAIQHDNNLVSIYKHNSALLKKVGQKVRKLEVIAIVGNTGTLTDGPHLHFELWHKGRPVNPGTYIQF